MKEMCPYQVVQTKGWHKIANSSDQRKLLNINDYVEIKDLVHHFLTRPNRPIKTPGGHFSDILTVYCREWDLFKNSFVSFLHFMIHAGGVASYSWCKINVHMHEKGKPRIKACAIIATYGRRICKLKLFVCFEVIRSDTKTQWASVKRTNFKRYWLRAKCSCLYNRVCKVWFVPGSPTVPRQPSCVNTRHRCLRCQLRRLLHWLSYCIFGNWLIKPVI